MSPIKPSGKAVRRRNSWEICARRWFKKGSQAARDGHDPAAGKGASWTVRMDWPRSRRIAARASGGMAGSASRHAGPGRKEKTR